MSFTVTNILLDGPSKKSNITIQSYQLTSDIRVAKCCIVLTSPVIKPCTMTTGRYDGTGGIVSL